MHFSLTESLPVLENTPNVLQCYLSGLSDEWVFSNEGEDTWSPYVVLGHLIVGEQTDWLVRVRVILGNGESKSFEPFDRFAQMGQPKQSITELLNTFKKLRTSNLRELKRLNISDKDLTREGIHPVFGTVTLQQLLSTWVVHDLNHIMQISRVMAHQYRKEVGPWSAYLRILKGK